MSIHGGDWVYPLRVKDLMLGWIRLPLRKKDSKLWKAAPLSLLWAIWKERNNVIFEDDCFSLSRLKSFFLRSLCSWACLIRGGGGGIVRHLFCIIQCTSWAGRFFVFKPFCPFCFWHLAPSIYFLYTCRDVPAFLV